MKKLIIALQIVFCLSLVWAPFIGAAGPDTLVVGVPSDIHTLDSGVSSDNYDWRQIYPCYPVIHLNGYICQSALLHDWDHIWNSLRNYFQNEFNKNNPEC